MFFVLFIEICFSENNDPHNLYLLGKIDRSTNHISYRPADIVIMYWSKGRTNFDWWKLIVKESDTNWFYVKEDFPKFITNHIGTNFKFIKFQEYENFIKHH